MTNVPESFTLGSVYMEHRILFIAVVLTLSIFYGLANTAGIGVAQTALMVTFVLTVIVFLFGKKRASMERLICYLLVMMPVINFSKGGFFFYNIITALLIIFHIILWLREPAYYKGNFGFGQGWFFLLFGIALFYYFSSFIVTGRYDANLRIFELLLTALLVPRLWKNRRIFLSMVIMLAMNCIAFVFFLMRQAGADSRLMLNSQELLEKGIEIGGNNPISYGLPIAFCIVTIYTYLRYTGFVRKTFSTTLLVTLFLCLFLTTSRGSFLVVIGGFVTYFLITRKVKALVQWSFVGLLGFYLVAFLAGKNENFRFAYDFLIERTQSGAGINKISHGRIEQWEAMYAYAKTDLADLIFGFGPGNQFDAHEIISMSLYGENSASFQGKTMAFHALPLQFLSEIGIVGTTIFYSVLFQILLVGSKYLTKTGLILPVLGFVGWFVAGLSVSSLDPFSGLFLGMAFIPIFGNGSRYINNF